MRAETHELDLLAEDFERASKEINGQVAKVTGRACLNIKRDVAKRWRGMPHLPHLPYVTTYDVKTLPFSVVGEVGADHSRRQGKLAWVAELGSPTSAPRPAYRPATDKELPSWMEWLDKVAAEALEKPR